MKKRISYLLTIFFLVLIFGIGFLNLKDFIPQICETVRQDATYFSEGGARMEEDYRVSFLEKNRWINLYGLSQRFLGREVIGDMDFVKTQNGLMDYVTRPTEVIPFANEMVEWKSVLDERGIPLLYIQMPAREAMDGKDPESLLKVRTHYKEIRSITDPAGIICMDEAEILAGENAPVLEEFFFKTDIHTTTESEVWMAGKIADKLMELFQIEIPEVIRPGDERYEAHSHPFLGNLAQSAGIYYNGIDTFTEYIPKEETQFRVSDLLGEWETSGSFEEVLMNGYDASEEEETYIYWVTNYLKYGYPAYRIENSNSNGPDLLIVCDSLCYRTLSYLAMSCRSITILDPRFYPDEGANLMETALNSQEYDAAIYLHGTFYTTKFSMFGEWSLEQ